MSSINPRVGEQRFLPGGRSQALWLRLRWRQLGWAIYFGLNLGMIAYQPWASGFDRDWAVLRQVASGADPYRAGAGLDIAFVWSPAMVPIVAAAMAAPHLWALLHIAALAAPRDAWFALVMLCSWGFWTDVAAANTFTFSVVAGLLAWRGSRAAAVVYIALLILMPRPILLPLALLLVFRDRKLVLPFAILLIAHTLMILPMLGEWVSAMVEYANSTPHDLGPRRFIGYVWIPIGLIGGALLLWRGHPGWAGLVASAYWLPQYFLFPLVELSGARRARGEPRAQHPDAFS